jgi:hypothetical protein
VVIVLIGNKLRSTLSCVNLKNYVCDVILDGAVEWSVHAVRTQFVPWTRKEIHMLAFTPTVLTEAFTGFLQACLILRNGCLLLHHL